MANGHGGARPGAGRKKQNTENLQIKRRGIIEETVTDEDWKKVVMMALSYAKAGDKAARDWLTPWIVGKVPDKVEVEQSGTLDIRYVNDWRDQ